MGINCNPHPKTFMNAEKFSSTLNEVVCELVADVLISNRLVIMLPKCILNKFTHLSGLLKEGKGRNIL